MISNNLHHRLEIFFSRCKTIRYKKKDIILYADDIPTNIFYIQSGYVRVYRISQQGEELTLTILKPDDFFPIWWTAVNSFNPYYFEAITPIEVRKAPQSEFRKFIREYPDIFYELANWMQVKFGGLLTRMEYLIFSNAYTKVAATILGCANRFGTKKGQDVVVNLPLTHKDIANLAGITRETTCLEMKKLEKKGLIAHQGRLLVIRDIKKLGTESLLTSSPLIDW